MYIYMYMYVQMAFIAIAALQKKISIKSNRTSIVYLKPLKNNGRCIVYKLVNHLLQNMFNICPFSSRKKRSSLERRDITNWS